jgi:hypothetical protein
MTIVNVLSGLSSETRAFEMYQVQYVDVNKF